MVNQENSIGMIEQQVADNTTSLEQSALFEQPFLPQNSQDIEQPPTVQTDAHTEIFETANQTEANLVALFKEFGIPVPTEPMRPELMTPEMQIVIRKYPHIFPVVAYGMPVLDTMYRGSGLTKYYDNDADDPYQERPESIAEHTVAVMQTIRETYDTYPALAELAPLDEVLTDALFHDFQEMYGGDLSRSMVFYNHPPFAEYLRAQGKEDLAHLMDVRDIYHMTNGLAHDYRDWWVKYEAHYADMQEEFGQRLFLTIADPDTAHRVAAGNERFEKRSKYMDDPVRWMARFADIIQEVDKIVETGGWDVERYARTFNRKGESVDMSLMDLQTESVDLSTWRLLQPAITLYDQAKGNTLAQQAVHSVVIDSLSKIASIPGNRTRALHPHEPRMQAAFDYWNRMAYEVNASSKTAGHYITELKSSPWLKRVQHPLLPQAKAA